MNLLIIKEDLREGFPWRLYSKKLTLVILNYSCFQWEILGCYSTMHHLSYLSVCVCVCAQQTSFGWANIAVILCDDEHLSVFRVCRVQIRIVVLVGAKTFIKQKLRDVRKWQRATFLESETKSKPTVGNIP